MQKNMCMCVTFFLAFFTMDIMLIQEYGTLNKSFYLDYTSIFLIFMTSVVMLSSIKKILENKLNMFIVNMLLLATIIFFLSFLTSNMFIFYIFFELSVCPLMFFVSAWGYSLERVKSMMYMFIFTFIFSFPFLIIIMKNNTNNLTVHMHLQFLNYSFNSTLMLVFMQLMFLVKMPIWGLHIWLTKAHVDASTEGSMILAGVVLKMAGVAMIKFMFVYALLSMEKSMLMFSVISVLGAVYMSMISIRSHDMKLIIAISSVIHMSFMYCCLTMASSMSSFNLTLVMVAHGMVSPYMFFFMGEFYENYYTRNLHLVKGILSLNIFMAMVWFLLCMYNMGLPLTLNFFSEILFFFTMMSFNKLITLASLILIFMNGLINTYLFISMHTGQKKSLKELKLGQKKLFMSYHVLLVPLLMFVM